MRNTLLLIFAALALMIGSFVWFVVTWDSAKEEPITRDEAPLPNFILALQLPPEAPL